MHMLWKQVLENDVPSISIILMFWDFFSWKIGQNKKLFFLIDRWMLDQISKNIS